MTPAPLGSTYRLQLHGLGLAGATALVPYLCALGIETVYLSPLFAAAPGSTHGYDVVDPGRIDPALGSPEELEALLDACRTHSLRILLDIVPNHMSTDTTNARWWDVLARGRASATAAVFDIDWDRHGGRVLVPVLGRPLGDVIADKVAVVDEGRAIELDGVRLPLAEGTGGGPVSGVLGRQHYRAAYWRSAATMGNYRRFFDINGLVGVRVEDPEVFEVTHELVVRLCADDGVAGVRVDHIDGLADPREYLERLRGAIENTGPKVVLVEKILARDEHLAEEWPVDGTTGYEFGDLAGGLLLDEEGIRRLAVFGAALTAEPGSFSVAAMAAKSELLARSFGSDLERLARLALRAMDTSHAGHDLSPRDVARALGALTVGLDVYRTYLDARTTTLRDRTTVERAAQFAEKAVPEQDEARRALDIVVESLGRRTASEGLWLEVARRWQQLSGAVMAKGVEDTATYRYPGLLAHAEVGCDPDGAATGIAAFHRFVQLRTQGLNATSTHDSKRNEDARCRLAVLSEASGPWERLVRRWHRRFAEGAGSRVPHPSEELATYQALFALWPPDAEHLNASARRRAQEYLLKAAREAKRHTSWDHPDGAYERRLSAFVNRVTHDEGFRNDMSRFSRQTAPAAVSNTLALLALKCCVPGTPDFFQGTELFEPVLTDPDNRRPVDFERRSHMADDLPAPSSSAAAAMLRSWPDGRLKLFVMRALLHERRRHRSLFAEGDYVPLASSSDHVVAFARRRGNETLICLVPRLSWTLAGAGRFPVGRAWAGERVRVPSWARGIHADLFTGRTHEVKDGLVVADAMHALPLVVLARDAG